MSATHVELERDILESTIKFLDWLRMRTSRTL